MVSNSEFQRAVDLLDAGDIESLSAWVDARPPSMLPHYDSVFNAQHEMDFALWYASMAGHIDIVSELIKLGANINMQSPLATTPLDDAIKYGQTELAEHLRSLEAKSFSEI